MNDSRLNNPVFGRQAFKLGLFGYLHEGGNYLTKHPGRWRADWQEISTMARLADRAGFDFLMPISSWKGWTAEVDHRKKSFETLTHAAGLAAITDRIAIFSTVHVPFVHPIFAAKALTTIDHISGGRAGLNIVCGWNPADNAMFGIEMREHDNRYDHGYEWWEIMSRILSSGDAEFDYDGEYFSGLKAVSGQPLAIQQPQIAIISATFSEAGRRFAAKTSDFILTAALPDSAPIFADVRAHEDAVGRTKAPLKLIAVPPVLCRETTAEAEAAVADYMTYVDRTAVNEWVEVRTRNATSTPVDDETKRLGAAGFLGINGSPQYVADQLIDLHRQGFEGAAISVFDFIEELPIIIDRVFPILERAGVRNPASKFQPGEAFKILSEARAARLRSGCMM